MMPFDFDGARRAAESLRDRVDEYLKALCDTEQAARISAALRDTESDPSRAMLAALMAMYDRKRQS
jgi:hypothetical protein